MLRQFNDDRYITNYIKENIPFFEEKSSVYTSEGGFTSDFYDVNGKWLFRIIMTSPKIIYGINYDIADTHHTFGFYS